MLFSAATALALGAGLVAAVPPLEVRGNSFVNPKTGNRFQVVGVAYQPGGSAGYKPDSGTDPLTQVDDCLRDAAIMQMLGINTIRIYNLNPNLNHDACASIFNAAGMYMMIDVNSPLVGESLTNFNPWESYYASYLNRTFAVVEAFKNYPNTLVFFSGNEVINDVATGKFVPQYQRAVTRDLKNYVAKHCDRKIPVGYSAADVREVLFDTYNYFSCAEDGQDDDPSRGDIFALNSYSWCGDSSFEKARYNELVSGFTGNALPVFYSEFGCIHPKPRMWTEIGTIYSDKMMPVFSGGIVYEYCQEENDYGLVQLKADGSADLLADFNNLRSQLSKVDFTTIQSSKPPTTANKPPKCEAKLITQQGFSTNFTLPVLPPGAKEIIDAGVSPKPSGKLITISDWKVKAPVRNTDGSVIANLAVKPLPDDGTNIPSTTSGSTPPPTQAGSGTSPSQTKPNGAGSLRATGLLAAMGAAALVGLVM